MEVQTSSENSVGVRRIFRNVFQLRLACKMVSKYWLLGYKHSMILYSILLVILYCLLF